MRKEVAAELGDVAAGAREALAGLQGGAPVAFGDRVGGGEDQGCVGNAKDGEDVVGLDPLAAVGDELVERAERVAEAPGRRAGDRRDRAIVDLDRFRGGDAAEDLGDLLRRRPLRSRSAGSDRRSWA